MSRRQRTPNKGVSAIIDGRPGLVGIGEPPSGLASNLDNRIEKIETLIAELRQAQSEAHGVLNDLNHAIKKAEQIVPMMVGKQLKGKIETHCIATIEEVQELLNQAVKKAGDKFDQYLAVLYGEERQDGRPPVMEMMEKLGDLVPVIRKIMSEDVKVHDITVVPHSEPKIVFKERPHPAPLETSTVPKLVDFKITTEESHGDAES